MSDNKNKTTISKFETLKVIIITLVALIGLTIILRNINDEEEKFILHTLSSEELAGETYTERTAFDDSDMWETESSSTEINRNNIIGLTESLVEEENIVDFPIDINLANAEELMQIDGIGTLTAEKIIAYRNMYGYYSNYRQLLEIDGIGEKKLENLMDYIYISEDWLETGAELTSISIETSIPDIYEAESETVTKSQSITEDIVIVNEEFADNYEETDIAENTDYEYESEHTITNYYVIFPLDLNSATVEELMCIEGIGEYTAQKITAYAQQYGFYSVEDLLNVDGIGSSKLFAIMPYVYVDSYMLLPKEETVYQESEIITEIVIKSVNVNTCGKQELMQLPGIDEEMAERIIAFRETIGGFLKIEELTLVEGMTNEKMSAIWNYVYI